METFDYGRAIGQLLMTFAIFVVLAGALNKVPVLARRPWIAYATSFVICLMLLLSSSAPLDVVAATVVLFLPLAFWRWYSAASKK